jgi:hypothetical protein
MKTFEIQYIGRLGLDTKEYYTEIIKARTKTSALNKFAKEFGIKKSNINTQLPELSWWDNEWLMTLRNIEEVTEQKKMS